MSELFDAVDALVEGRGVLPPPAERERLRKAHGLTQEQVAAALKVRRATLVNWESGKTEPRPPQREAYVRLLDKLAALYPAPAPASLPASVAPPAPAALPAQSPATETPPASAPEPAPVPAPAPTPVPSPAADPAWADTPVAGRVRAAATGASRAPRATASRSGTKPSPDARFAGGPLVVLDGDGTAYGVGGLVLECPAEDIPSLAEWALGEARLGAPRLHRNGKDADPLVVLTAGAAERLGLPARLEDRRGLRLPENHEVVERIARADWRLTRRGFGPWARVYRPARSGTRQCLQLAVLPWNALDARAWGSAADLPPAELAAVLGDYATRVITPRGSTAVNGLELMTALRPPTRAVLDHATGGYVSGPAPGALTGPVDPAPPEAPDEHPIARGRADRDVLDEEAYEWIRELDLLGDAECAHPYVIGLDVNMAFAAAANRLTVGLGAPVHVVSPAFDPKTPGAWLVDLSGIDLDPRLPSPFTPRGTRPLGPAWYATPTVAYAAELGHHVRPFEAWIRPDNGPYLDTWYTRLRDAYLTTMARLGVVPGMEPADFLDAMADHKRSDPGQAAVLSAIKATVKGGIGKLRERPQGVKYRPGEPWPALERPTWRPDIRAAVISTARVNMHRKMSRLAEHGLFPLAVLSDCVVYPSPGPSPLDVLPLTPDGAPLPGGFRLGVSPGMVKCEGVQSFLWAAGMLEDGHNPARHIKGTDV